MLIKKKNYLLLNKMSDSNFEKRIEESTRIIGKYPDRVPIIVEAKHNTKLQDLDKHKYLVPKEMTVGQFIYVIRKRLKLKKDQAIFVFVDNKLPVTSELIERLYDSHKNEDGFMYMVYAGESTFG
jgi:GABA(A) receptor-associated protein